MKYLRTLRECSWRVAKSPTLIVGPCFLSVMLRQGRADILFGMAGSCAEGHESLCKAFSGGEGGILNQALELSCHVFSNMCENRMDIGDFHGLACCNCFYPSAWIVLISNSNRHQRHQTRKLTNAMEYYDHARGLPGS